MKNIERSNHKTKSFLRMQNRTERLIWKYKTLKNQNFICKPKFTCSDDIFLKKTQIPLSFKLRYL